MSALLTRHRNGSLSYLRGGDGPPLLLLHGAPGSAHSWAGAGRVLTAHYDVIIPDLPGFGASDPSGDQLHLDHALYAEAHADTVYHLLNHLEVDTLFLGGHNFGGLLALTLLRLFPDLSARGLALAASTPFTDVDVPFPLQLASVPGIGRAALWAAFGTRPGLRMLYRIAVQNRISFPRPDFERHLTPSSLRHTRRIFQRHLVDPDTMYRDAEVLLPKLDLPTIVLWGDQDPFQPVDTAGRLVSTLPESTLSIFDDTGHFVPEERPEMTAWHVDDFFRTRTSSGFPADPERSPL
jgi:pimeloyl-ACP methyl ester carboxylesterase